ncbi:MAG: ATP-binding protein [Bacteroidia bacterium]|nr:ATP-binding protein [Bacteroidia bacterium]
MNRYILRELEKWKKDQKRKSLLLRGARQIGKTYIIRELGKQFKYFLEVNFDSESEIRQFFDGNLNPNEICTKLSAYYNIPIVDGETLLFLDEIQICKPAIQSLRYFHERRPNLHVVATGSLLEFALEEIPSFGVGRITSLFMYPMSFNEFLEAAKQTGLIKMKKKASPESSLDETFHKNLTDWIKKFMIVGGMPEAVKTFIDTGDLIQTQRILDNIIISLEDDFAKYKSRINVGRLKDVFRSVMNQSGNKFNVSKSSENGNQVQKNEALEMLIMSGLCYKVLHSSANGLPLSIGKNSKIFKVIFFDTGIIQRSLKLKMADFITAENLNQINKGNIAEQYTGIELIKNLFTHSKPELYYWHREKRSSSAEVDYLLELNNKILPVEVKSGTQGKMQSLHIFMESKKTNIGIRISLENFSKYQKIEVFPLYAIERIIEINQN